MADRARVTLQLYFVRHGRTEMNRLGLLQGQGGHGLLPEGREDAARAAEHLAGRGVRVLYSSDLQRAAETARIIRSDLGVAPRIRYSRFLREMDYGTLTGRPEIEVRRRFPLYRRDARFVFPEGESFALVQRRALRWLAGVLEHRSPQTAAVITHGGWLRTLFAGLLGVPLNQCLRGTVAHGVAGCLEVDRLNGLRLELSPGVSILPRRP
jgi:broad specificity phosphatase PhoE